MESLLTLKDLEEILQVSRSTLWRLRKKGAMPEPISGIGRFARWRKVDIDQWLETLTHS